MQLAQANIAFFRWPLTDPRMAEFVSRIDVMHALAESSDGFVWRYAEEYNGTRFPPPFDDARLFFNLSVWRDVASLRRFVFDSAHVEMLRHKSEWIVAVPGTSLVMWWIEDDAPMPTFADAVARFRSMEQKDGQLDVFSFGEE